MPTEPLTEAELAELRRLDKAATPAPWARVWLDMPTRPEDMRMLAEARNALPRLLDELELLRRRDREQAAGEEVLRQQLRDAERKIEMLRGERG